MPAFRRASSLAGPAHAAALAWLNLGRLALVAGDDEELGKNACVQLLEELDDPQRVLKLAQEARAADKPHNALIVLDELLPRYPDDEDAGALWFEIALDDPFLDTRKKEVDDLATQSTDLAVKGELAIRRADRELALALGLEPRLDQALTTPTTTTG